MMARAPSREESTGCEAGLVVVFVESLAVATEQSLSHLLSGERILAHMIRLDLAMWVGGKMGEGLGELEAVAVGPSLSASCLRDNRGSGAPRHQRWGAPRARTSANPVFV